MSISATGRYGLVPAPAGLALVHDLANTRAGGRPRKADLLDSGLETAQEWFTSAVDAWTAFTGCSPPEEGVLVQGDLERLITLRSALIDILRRDGPASSGTASWHADVRLTLTAEGQVLAQPRGDAASWLTGAVLIEVQRAHEVDTWRRLKVCRNLPCSGAFYDRSKNNSGVWHDVRTCGNAANLKASRARKRAQPI